MKNLLVFPNTVYYKLVLVFYLIMILFHTLLLLWRKLFQSNKILLTGTFEWFWLCGKPCADVHYCEREQFSTPCHLFWMAWYSLEYVSFCGVMVVLGSTKSTKNTQFWSQNGVAMIFLWEWVCLTFFIFVNWNDATGWIVVLTEDWQTKSMFCYHLQ